ncbi:tetratricopeptide repeat protein [Anianabacter salinae]|uniref:tetratricopeptide repeat protein n=1 Tax=Anianabacter salinae TaxID=2851023 RepID=UPI00225E42B2|nr:tetratricopeptide repeat protein [Anianabacter salinae]MBV0911378.1 tetratricopeptide repeat protein [Anianabacter salinae]
MRALIVALIMAPTTLLAETCPQAPDHEAEMAAIIARLQAAPTEGAARPEVNRLWEIWTDAPDAAAQEMLDRGMRARSSYDWDGARAAFDELTAYCPDYPEGYNQRAFVDFLRGNYGAALEDLERTLERDPDHIAAMSGLALTLLRLGRDEAGQAALRSALKLNPWLPERGLLVEPPGKDI